jgi:hypothetical protein
MTSGKKLKKGDIVKIVSNTKFDEMLKENFAFVGTVLECRHKTNAYLVFPANSPFYDEPYWTDGKHLEKLES